MNVLDEEVSKHESSSAGGRKHPRGITTVQAVSCSVWGCLPTRRAQPSPGPGAGPGNRARHSRRTRAPRRGMAASVTAYATLATTPAATVTAFALPSASATRAASTPATAALMTPGTGVLARTRPGVTGAPGPCIRMTLIM